MPHLQCPHGRRYRDKWNHCKLCARKRAKAWRLLHPGRAKSRSTEWRKLNPERTREILYKAMGYPIPTRPTSKTCECCGRVDKRALCLDHDHVTGNFRGWICDKCNRGIGMLGDNALGVCRALRYLLQGYVLQPAPEAAAQRETTDQ